MEAILFDGRTPVGPLDHDGMDERTVIVGSMSKAYRMIGWRVGWIAGPHEIVSDAGWVHVYNTTGAVSVARKAATAVLRGPQDHVHETTAELQRRRDAIFEALPEQRLVRPAGGWSLLLEVDDPAATSKAMLEAGVAATPMIGWGAEVAATLRAVRVQRRTRRAPRDPQGSILVTVPSRKFAVHTAPSPTAIPIGSSPVSIGSPTTSPVAAIDPRHGVVARVRHPHVALPDREFARVRADRDRLADDLRLGVDPRHGVAARVRDPHGPLADGDAAQLPADVDRIAGRGRRHVDRRHGAVVEARDPGDVAVDGDVERPAADADRPADHLARRAVDAADRPVAAVGDLDERARDGQRLGRAPDRDRLGSRRRRSGGRRRRRTPRPTARRRRPPGCPAARPLRSARRSPRRR